jgi:hypothetical protein
MLLTREQDDLPDLDEPEDWGGTWPIIVAAVIKIVSRGMNQIFAHHRTD